MKKIILCSVVLLSFTTIISAQVKKKYPVKQVKITKVNPVQQYKATEIQPGITTLSSTGTYPAYGRTQGQVFSISDPVIRAFNENNGSVLGVSKLRYGVIHGHMIFYPTSTTSSGSSTGSGSVGTGSSIGNIGMNESALGANGKNPYAGPAMYGTGILIKKKD
jgi:hypothetical protein